MSPCSPTFLLSSHLSSTEPTVKGKVTTHCVVKVPAGSVQANPLDVVPEDVLGLVKQLLGPVSKSPAVHERTAHADELRRLSREHQHSHGRAGRETSENLERHSHLEVMKREREARRGERRRDSTFSRSTEEVKAQVLGVKQHRLWT